MLVLVRPVPRPSARGRERSRSTERARTGPHPPRRARWRTNGAHEEAAPLRCNNLPPVLHVEAEEQDVPVLHHVLLPLGAHQPLVAGGLDAAEAGEVVVGDGLGANEAALEVAVDHAGGLGALGADGDGPGADLL